MATSFFKSVKFSRNKLRSVSATFAAVAINLAVVLVSYLLATRTPASLSESAPAPAAHAAAKPESLATVYIAIALSGAVSLGAEVVWIDEGADPAQQNTELRLMPEAGITPSADAARSSHAWPRKGGRRRPRGGVLVASFPDSVNSDAAAPAYGRGPRWDEAEALTGRATRTQPGPWSSRTADCEPWRR